MSLGTTVSNTAAAALAVEGEIRCIVQGVQASSCGRVVTINHNDPSINVVLDAGFDRLVVERSTDGGITFKEAMTPSERIVLERDTADYTWRDKKGDPTFLYRTRYINTKTCELCDPSDPVEGASLALGGVLSVEQLKQRYMFGVDLTDDAGNLLPDSVFQFYILAAIEWMEHELDLRVLPTNFPNERHDYYREDYAQFNLLQLDNYPVISLDEFRVQYPSGQNVIIYPDEWIRLDKVHGLVRIVPTAGTLSEIIIGQGGSFLPAIFNGMAHLPDLFEVDYVAGFECIPANIVNLIGMAASMGPFNIFGDLIAGAGIANVSLSIDGLSQSIGTTSSATNSGYGARIIQYGKQIKAELPTLRRFYKGIRLVSV